MRLRHLLATAAAMLLAAPALAQQPTPPTPVDPNAPRPVQRAERALDRAQDRVERAQDRAAAAQRVTALRPVQPSMNMNTDQMIARCMIFANHGEVEFGKLALQHAQSPKTKEFAQQMVDDHSKALTALTKIAPNTTNTVAEDGAPQLPADIKPAPASGGAFAPPQPGESTEGRVAATRPFNFMEIQQRLAEQCLNSTKLSLLEHKGADFDAAYIGTMIVKHQEMLDHQSVLRDYASPEFRKMIEAQMDTTQMHLDHAKQLMRTVSVKAAKEEAPATGGAIQPSRS